MKKNYITTVLILGLFFSTRLFGQIEIVPDPNYTPYYFLEKTNIPEFDPENLFELRVWITQSLSPYNKTLFRIQFSKDSVWNAEKYTFDLKRKKNTLGNSQEKQISNRTHKFCTPRSLGNYI